MKGRCDNAYLRIGIDAGGTFTDFVIVRDNGALESFKLRSNPDDPASVILSGIQRAAQGAPNAEIVHGSTVATNALLERKGARTAFVTTSGFEDLLSIGRQNRKELYNLTPVLRPPFIPPELCFGNNHLRRLPKLLKDAGAESVAVCLLGAFRDPAPELEVKSAIGDRLPASLSSEICPEFREYERASTTAVNAYVGPLMERYLRKLSSSSPYPISVMQSNGGVLDAGAAARLAVRTILSGPAGGVVGAYEMARRAGFRKVIGFDMGGTSTDVCLCDGRYEETTEAYIDGMPIRVPMLDIHTVGAGGGSIARIDEGGLLRVGPESAGADPGPACYGIGDRPTVTDANVVLRRIRRLLGGEMRLDRDRARAALATLRMPPLIAARGVIDVANANMERAIRAVSVERGYDPRDFALLAFGGAAGLHACAIAESLGMRTVLAPAHAGVLSALGLLMADRIEDYARGAIGHPDPEAIFQELEIRAGNRPCTRFADLRYAGQSYELTVPWNNALREFERMHKRLYGYQLDREVEVVTLRLRVRTKTPRLHLSPGSAGRSGRGPEIVETYGSTVFIPKRWRFRTNPFGTLVIQR